MSKYKSKPMSVIIHLSRRERAKVDFGKTDFENELT